MTQAENTVNMIDIAKHKTIRILEMTSPLDVTREPLELNKAMINSSKYPSNANVIVSPKNSFLLFSLKRL